MNTRHILILLAALAIVGCSKKESPTSTTSSGGGGAGTTLDQAAARDGAARAGDALTTAWNSIKDASYDDRVRFRASLDSLAATVDTKISQLQTQATSATAATREKLTSSLTELRSARADLQKEISELSSATAESWNQTRADVARAWERVQRSYTELEAQRTTL